MKRPSIFHYLLLVLCLMSNTTTQAPNDAITATPSPSPTPSVSSPWLTTTVKKVLGGTVSAVGAGVLAFCLKRTICKTTHCCCILGVKRFVRHSLANLSPAEVIKGIRTIITDRLSDAHPGIDLVIDLDGQLKDGVCDRKFVIASQLTAGSISYFGSQRSLHPTVLGHLRNAYGVVLICGDFNTMHDQSTPHNCTIQREEITAATSFLGQNHIPFLIIHVREHIAPSTDRRNLQGSPSFTLKCFSSLADSNASQDSCQVRGVDALKDEKILAATKDTLRHWAGTFAVAAYRNPRQADEEMLDETKAASPLHRQACASRERVQLFLDEIYNLINPSSMTSTPYPEAKHRPNYV